VSVAVVVHRTFVDWLISKDGQATIAGYGIDG
jgi:hypothetical protein